MLTKVSIEQMGIADTLLFTFLALADFSLMIHMRRRRQRRLRLDRMMRSLRLAVRRDIGIHYTQARDTRGLVLQRAS